MWTQEGWISQCDLGWSSFKLPCLVHEGVKKNQTKTAWPSITVVLVLKVTPICLVVMTKSHSVCAISRNSSSVFSYPSSSFHVSGVSCGECEKDGVFHQYAHEATSPRICDTSGYWTPEEAVGQSYNYRVCVYVCVFRKEDEYLNTGICTHQDSVSE